MPADAAWPAPAKLNLFLHIVGRRDDGYHLLQTVFQFLDRGDSLFFTPRADGAIRRSEGLADVPQDQDLCVRAARALQAAAGVTQGVDIRLEKHLPMGGGLGGGSSDAATTLVALNRLWRCGLSPEALAQIGLTLGADVPVFVHGQAAWAEGVGERLTPVQLPEPWYVVLCPPVHVATGALFQAPELTRNCPPLTIRDFSSGAGDNVFEPVVRARYPEVDAALNALGTHAPTRLTGSGGCLFAAFPDRDAAQAAHEALAGRWPGFVARGRNRSILLDRLFEED
jgi:4-diphosphocytidyl-2-C-methyl-D-erythritol kinase